MMKPSAVGLPRTGSFHCCDIVPAQMERTVVYGTARTGECLNVAMKKSQSVPFQGRHDCRLATVCTNETLRNTVGYARMNVIGSRTSFVIVSVRSSIH